MLLAIRVLGFVVFVAFALGSWSPLPAAQIFPEPLVIACGDQSHPPDLIPQIRAAASIAASAQLSGENDTDALSYKLIEKLISLGEFEKELSKIIQKLEQIAQGPNHQCRSVPIIGYPGDYLPLLYFERSWARAAIAVGGFDDEPELLREFLLDVKRIIDSVAQIWSFELALGRALSLTTVPLFVALMKKAPSEIRDELFNLGKWERVTCGGKEKFPQLGLEIDGSLFIRNNDSQGFPFRETAATLWRFSIDDKLLARDPRFRETLLDKALQGCSPELRAIAARLYVEFRVFKEGLRTEGLSRLALEGGSTELRAAAASHLAYYLASDRKLSDEDLQRLALTGKTSEFKSAAGLALGQRWQLEALIGKLGLTTVFSFIGPDRRTLQQGNLIQFAAAHTGVHPELAQAAILPLSEIFLKGLSRLNGQAKRLPAALSSRLRHLSPLISW